MFEWTAHRVHIGGRGEIGGVYLPSQLELSITTLLVLVLCSVHCAPLTLTRLGKFYHLDGMYAKQWPRPLCVLCGQKVVFRIHPIHC